MHWPHSYQGFLMFLGEDIVEDLLHLYSLNTLYCNPSVNFIKAYTIYMIETAVAVDEIFTTAGTMYIHEAFTDQNNITDINIVYFITNL